MIDGVYNDMRKLYILTTNKLSIDENLLGRPGRIRYIKEFSNLSARAVNDVIDDNLKDVSLKEEVLKVVDSLEISTIDILKAIREADEQSKGIGGARLTQEDILKQLTAFILDTASPFTLF